MNNFAMNRRRLLTGALAAGLGGPMALRSALAELDNFFACSSSCGAVSAVQPPLATIRNRTGRPDALCGVAIRWYLQPVTIA